ncbi:MAG: 2-C-methyl-D-erythritol 4-phosphate cytidylyltransferase [Dehalococcoidia bacterium]|nr:2-C-methyl-D-erythritol 4-phosphate cytidylyltransferase [Dehalococcoidia bacterium]
MAELVGAVVPAGGSGRRMEGRDKTFAPLLGVPLVAYAVEALLACPLVACVVLVLPPSSLGAGEALSRARAWGPRVRLCRGGARRQDSVRLGVQALGPCDWVVVHDGARPCLTAELVAAGLQAARETGAAIAAIPLNDTVKEVDQAGTVVRTPPRAALRAAQTPQVFRYDLLLEAHRRAAADVTDDAALVEAIGGRVRTFLGDSDNIKVTVPADLALAEAVLRRRAQSLAQRPGG